MPAYFKKNKGEILSQALTGLQKNTPITAVGPGSIARAMTEVFSSELGDMYDILDFNMNQMILSTATGNALDAFGVLYGIERKTLSQAVAIDKKLGAFQFFLSTAYGSDIRIPSGTKVYTDTTTYMGRQFSYTVQEDAIIPAGRLKAYASIKPSFVDSVFTAGVNTLVMHDFLSPAGATVFCTNNKIISPQVAYEDDDSYRLRIIKAIRLTSGGTMQAVRFAGLGVSGVRDVSIKQAPYGMGSFEVVVTPESASDVMQVTTTAQKAMNAVRPLGVRMFVKNPQFLVANVDINLIIPTANAAILLENTTQRARVGAQRYLNSLLPGSTLVYNKLIQTILESSDFVKDAVLTKFSVDGQEILRKNFVPRYDQQIVAGTINVTVANS